MKKKLKKLFSNKLFLFVFLFVVCVGIFLGFLYWREAGFSTQIMQLEITGPQTATMGDEIEYTVHYKNNSSFVLENPRITFDLPDYSLTEDGRLRLKQNLNNISPGDGGSVIFRGRLLGKEGDLRVAKAAITYTPQNLSAVYESDATFTTKIDTVPVTLTYDLSSKVEKGKELSYSINYFSDMDYPLENLSIKVDNQNGFTAESAVPSSLDNIEWKLNTLNKSQGGRITIKGLVSADTGTGLNFSAHLGMWVDGTFIVIKDINQTVDVIQPLLYISQQINGSEGYIPSPGEALNYQISLRNIGTTPFNGLSVISKISGSAFDLSTLTSSDGQVNQIDGSITWNPQQVFSLENLGAQQEADVNFIVKLKSNFDISDAEKNNLVIKNNVSASDINQEFDTKVNSDLGVSQKAYYSNQAGTGILNSGSIPPRANSATTYTITWQVGNDFNDVKNIKVKAILPNQVSLTGITFPSSQASSLSFDNSSRQVVWSAGDLTAGGQTSLSFQVSLNPTFSQVGSLAQLIGQATILGDDQFTGATIQSSAPSVNTSLPDDSTNSGGGIVQ